jgi:anti-sigma B factor antagonist
VQPLYLESIAAGGGCAVLRIAGEVDVFTAPHLRERVIHLVDNGALHIIADLREVTFLDSTGLGALVGSLKRLRAREGSLTLVISADRIARIFRITGLHHVFVLRPSVQEAVTTDQHWQAAVAGDGHSTEDWCRNHGLL